MPLRPLTAADRETLELATYENLNHMGKRFSLDDVRTRAEFSHYFDRWPGPADFGFADVDADARIRGVVWLTHFARTDPGYGFVSPDIPELSIWVDRIHRGQGIGGDLISAVLHESRSRRVPGLSLSVEAGNPARRLYERCGFTQAGPGFDDGTLALPLP